MILISVMGFSLFVSEYTHIPKREFEIEGYYKGTRGDRSDPRETYNQLMGSKTEFDNSCNTTAKLSEKGKLTPSNAVWIVEGEEFTEELATSMVKVEDDDLSYKPFKNGGVILAPAVLVFKNSNVVQGSFNNISIHASLGDGMTIEFNNIKSWYCHMGKEIQLHTEVVGYQGLAPEVTESTILGEATAETVVKMYKEVDGVQTQVDLLSYFRE